MVNLRDRDVDHKPATYSPLGGNLCTAAAIMPTTDYG